jgi:integrase/recombinase XerD
MASHEMVAGAGRPSQLRGGAGPVIPAVIRRAGDRAARRFLEFFAATIRNANTREAYYRACCRFLGWCEENGINDLDMIEPLHVAAYVEGICRDFSKPTVKQHLAAIRSCSIGW